MSKIKGIKVGTTSITASYTDVSNDTDSQELEVTKVSLYSIDTPDNEIYTGNALTPLSSVYAYVGDDSGTKTTLVKDTDYELYYSNNTNVGTATVTATGKGNFTGTVSATFLILSAEITVTKSDQSYVYTGSKQGDGVSATTFGNQTPVIKYRTTSGGTYNLTDVPQKTHVSESGIVYYQVSADNHTTVEGSYQLDITPYVASLTWGTTSWTYDGDEHSTTCTVANLIGNDTCTVILSNNSITNAGTVTVTATGLSNSDYELPSEGLSKTLTVNPGMFIKVSGNWTPVKKVYKKISGTWVQQELTSSFNTELLYMERE